MRASPPARRTGPDRPKTAPPFDSAGLLAEAAGNTPMKRSALFVTLALLAAAFNLEAVNVPAINQ